MPDPTPELDLFPWRRASVAPGTPDQAVETVVQRLADLHEAISGVRPERGDEPAHVTLVRWSPILADYAMFARRANHAAEKRVEAEDRRDRDVAAANRRAADAVHEKSNAVRTLRTLESSVREAVKILDSAPAPRTPCCPDCRDPMTFIDIDMTTQGGPPENTWFCTRPGCGRCLGSAT